MLNQLQISNMLASFCFLLSLLPLGHFFLVTITNEPGFYYSRYCELTFEAIHSYPQLNDSLTRETFYVIVDDELPVTFKADPFEPPFVYLSDSRVIAASAYNSCPFKPSARSFCVQIMSVAEDTRLVKQELKLTRHRLNSTHQSYKWGMRKIICPSYTEFTGYKDKDGSSAMKIKIQRVNSSHKVTESGQFVINWHNPLSFPDISQFTLHESVFRQEQAKGFTLNRILGCQSYLQFSVMFEYNSLVSNWEKIVVKMEGVRSTQFEFIEEAEGGDDKELCKYSKQPMNNPAFKESSQFEEMPCHFDYGLSALVLTNPHFVANRTPITSYVNSDDPYQYDLYGFYDYPANRLEALSKLPLNLTFRTSKLVIKTQSQITMDISIVGIVEAQSNITGLMFSNREQSSRNSVTIFTFPLAEYLKLNSTAKNESYMEMCENSDSGEYDSLIPPALLDIFNFTFHSPSFISPLLTLLLSVILMVVIGVRMCISPHPTFIEKCMFLLLVMADPVIKIALLAAVSSAEDEQPASSIQFCLCIVMLIQYFLSFTSFWSYAYVIIKHFQLLTEPSSQNEERVVGKGLLAGILLTLLINYKFYSVFLFHAILQKVIPQRHQTAKIYRLRNDQLYIKYIYHLGIEGVVLLIFIFAMSSTKVEGEAIQNLEAQGSSMSYRSIILVYCICQALMCYLMAVIARGVFEVLKIKKIKKRVYKILQEKKERPGRQNQQPEIRTHEPVESDRQFKAKSDE